MGRNDTTAAMFPGMPDAVKGQPAKADIPPPMRTLDEAIARSHDIIAEVLDRYPIVARQALFSGGNDSAVLLHLTSNYLGSSEHDAVLHVNTGIGIEETRAHVRDVVRNMNLPLRELYPRDSYDDLVLGRVLARTGPNAGKRAVWVGMPGPGGDSHKVMYSRLKDEPLQRNRASIVGKNGRSQKVMYLAGMRWDESDRRMRNAEEIDPEGAIIWCSPIVHFTNAQMAEYRTRFRLPRNPVSAHLHMSGECLCGAFAKPGELDEIEFFYPKTAYRIRALEKRVEAAGIPACKWGVRPPGVTGTARSAAGRLCAKCVPPLPGQTDLMDEWIRQGLITSAAPVQDTTAPDDLAGPTRSAPEQLGTEVNGGRP